MIEYKIVSYCGCGCLRLRKFKALPVMFRLFFRCRSGGRTGQAKGSKKLGVYCVCETLVSESYR